MPMALFDMLILAAIAFGVATFGSIVGVGGGFLLMPILLFMYPGKSQEELTFISLFAVFVNAVAATLDYLRMKRVDVKSGLILGCCTVPTSIAARFLLHSMDRSTFSRVFGLILVAIGLLILWRAFRSKTSAAAANKPVPAHWSRRRIVDESGMVYEYAYDARIAVSASVGTGLVGSFMGIGGGVFLVPIFTQLLRFPAHVAAATSILVLSFNAATALLTDVGRHTVAGGFGDVPLLSAAVVGAGAYLGARCGTRLSRRVTGQGILALLAAAIILAGCRLALVKAPPPAAGDGPTQPSRPVDSAPADKTNDS